MMTHRIVDVNGDNVDEFGLLCFKSKKNTDGYKDKLAWTRRRFDEGLREKLLLVDEGKKSGLTARGFIEYIPGKFAWRGISADGYMVIHCLWVVGRHRGHGYGSELLKLCLDDAKDMDGVAVVTGKTWLPGSGLLVKNGFKKVGVMPADCELYAIRFNAEAPWPKFNVPPGDLGARYAQGLTVFRSRQCPYTAGSVYELQKECERMRIPFRVLNMETCAEAQMCAHPYGTFCVLFDGKVISYRPIGARGLRERLSGLT